MSRIILRSYRSLLFKKWIQYSHKPHVQIIKYSHPARNYSSNFFVEPKSRSELLLTTLGLGMLLSALIRSRSWRKCSEESENSFIPTRVTDFSVQGVEGEKIPLQKFKGKVILITNIASKWGLTNSQLPSLQELYEKYQDKDFIILSFPSNSFNQEFQTNEETLDFLKKFSLSFPVFSKVSVNGPDTDPLFAFLKQQAPGILNSQKIKWNYTKFLVDRDGNVVKRYAPNVTAKEIESDPTFQELIGTPKRI